MQGLSQRVIEGFNGKEDSSSIVILSGGGMDSFAIALKWATERFTVNAKMYLLAINYGQRTWEDEIKAIQAQAIYLYETFNIDAQVWAETIEWEDNPQGENGSTDYVPNRNLTFLVNAARVAEQFKCEEIGIGIIANHQPGNEISFLDTTPQFLYSVEQSLKWSSRNPPAIYAPFATVPKFIVLHHLVHIMQEYSKAGTDFTVAHHALPSLTYSCYHSNKVGAQCGKCSSCVNLKRAFLYADIDMPYLFAEDIKGLAESIDKDITEIAKDMRAHYTGTGGHIDPKQINGSAEKKKKGKKK